MIKKNLFPYIKCNDCSQDKETSALTELQHILYDDCVKAKFKLEETRNK